MKRKSDQIRIDEEHQRTSGRIQEDGTLTWVIQAPNKRNQRTSELIWKDWTRIWFNGAPNIGDQADLERLNTDPAHPSAQSRMCTQDKNHPSAQ
jgi:hypothetical protein